ncbi:G2 and S phase-expressed protein 1 isoform X1 [Tamandua tetradactyla]|uniref:G2 and S phase-expressed protein 1 isoform X1 n=1 Tax=Tamandua tetradactyla TaxID=48850 RepID=UPI0040548399
MEGGRGADVPSADQAGEAQMGAPGNDDILLLTDEKFDFDLSLSSSSADEDDEVFFGPVGHKEKCIAAGLELNNQIPEESDLAASWSPLTGEKFVEVYKEAHLLALQIKSKSKNKAAKADKSEDPLSQGVENFVQESQLKMNLFEKENGLKKSPKSLKRETYYLSDSPLMGPLLSGARTPLEVAPFPDSPCGLQGTHAQASLPETQQLLCSAGSYGAADLSAAHRPHQVGMEKRTMSRLQPPRASAIRGKNIHLAMEKPKKEVPVSSSRMKILNNKEAHGEVLPDKSRATLDAMSLPTSGSHLAQGQKSRLIPNKLGLKTLLKPPGCTGNLARKTYSSGSVLTCSTCASPAVGKATVTISAYNSRPLPDTSKFSRLRPAIQQQPLHPGPRQGSYKQTKEAEIAVYTREQPKEPTTALPQPQTPENRSLRLNSNATVSKSQLNKTGSTRRQDSYLNSKMQFVPTPTNQFKIPEFSIGESPDNTTPEFSRAQRPQSCCSVGRVVHSTPARHSSEPAPQNLSSARTPISTARMSALPTPASRRLSGLPLMTPKTMPRTLASPLGIPARCLSSELQRKSAMRTKPTKESNRKETSRQSDLPSTASFPPPLVVPQALNFSPDNSDFIFKNVTIEATLNGAKATKETSSKEALLIDINLDPLTIAPEAGGGPLIDIPLIDFCTTPEANGEQLPLKLPLTWESESKPLIDLTINTPDMNKDVALKPFQVVGQLIDLGSPLIQLSPEADKENVDSPLLKF